MSVLPNIFNTGRSGMVAAKAGIATAGHNISNAKTEGYSRQRVSTIPGPAANGPGRNYIGTGTLIDRVERVNDQYLEKQIRANGRELAGFEEKDVVLRQTEDVFNEMNGDGLNRLVSRFFNEFRKLSNEPENEALRQSVREASQSMVNDFHRIRSEVDEIRKHIDSRLEGYTKETNQLADQLKELNLRIKVLEGQASGGPPNDLLDRRDQVMKKLSSYMDLQIRQDGDGSFAVDIPRIGPYVNGPNAEKFSVERSPADGRGKPDNAVDVKTTASVSPNVTHVVHGGKMGALLEARDQTLSTVLERLDEMAFALTNAVNDVHQQGFTKHGAQGVDFFKHLDRPDRAAEFIDLSGAIRANVNNIATAAQPDSPGDNRIAIAISGLQNVRLMNDGKATLDDHFNSMVSDVGVAGARNRNNINQQKDIVTQLDKMREQISGVSIDEETANLMQYQHAFDASAKVIQVADECLKTVLELKRT
jgi:flagellar hook-associated protein 1 FlgK